MLHRERHQVFLSSSQKQPVGVPNCDRIVTGIAMAR